jgi:hypothetical protein
MSTRGSVPPPEVLGMKEISVAISAVVKELQNIRDELKQIRDAIAQRP